MDTDADEDEDGDEELGMFADDAGVIASDAARDVAEEHAERWFGENQGVGGVVDGVGATEGEFGGRAREVDEVVDGGAILETDANAVANRVQMRGVEGGQPITDMTASQAISTITDQIFKTMNT